MSSPLGEGPTYSKHIPTYSNKWEGGGEGEVTRKKNQENTIYMYQDQMF